MYANISLKTSTSNNNCSKILNT